MARSRLSSSVAKPMTPVGTSTETSAPSFASERAAVQQALDSFCARWLGDIAPLTAEAIRYSLLGEGKRLRAILLMEAYRACGGTGDARDLAAAVEVVHAYSLVHDDLPCMDDDDVRRGRPTVHRVYGVPVATAAGLAMVPMAARSAWHASKAMGLTDAVAGDTVRDLMDASGAGGMIGGQLLDLEAEGVPLTLEALERVHRLKTGALIMASVTLGARAAPTGASPVRRRHRSRVPDRRRCLGHHGDHGSIGEDGWSRHCAA